MMAPSAMPASDKSKDALAPTARRQPPTYTKLRKIGQGSYGKVYLVRSSARDETLVMKTVSLQGLPVNAHPSGA
jgi:serine/threonine protein kinase